MNHGSRSGAGLLVLSARWPKHVLALWVLLTVACVAVIALKAGTAFSTEVQRDDDSGSTRAQSLMRERFPDRPESDPFNEILVLARPRSPWTMRRFASRLRPSPTG
jgi:hypothetical protein